MRELSFYLLLAFVATIPLESVLTLGSAGSVNKWVGLAAGVAWVVHILLSGGMRNLRSFSSFHGFVVVFFALGFASLGMWSHTTDFSLTTLPFLAIMVVMFWDQLRTEWSVDAAVQVFVIGVLAASASLIYNFSSGVVVIDAVYVERYSARATDPNELGVMLGLSVAFAVYLFTKESAGWPWLKWLNVLAIPVGVLSIGLTGSRAAVLALVPVLVYVIARVIRQPQGRRLLLLGALVLGVWSMRAYVPDTTISRGFGTTEGTSVVSNLGDRTPLWEEGLKIFADNSLNGVGVGSYTLHAASGQVAHNVFIQVGAELGVAGLLLFGGAVTMAVRASFRMYRRKEAIWLAALAVWLAGAMTLSVQFDKVTWFVLTMAVVAVKAVPGWAIPLVGRGADRMQLENPWSDGPQASDAGDGLADTPVPS